MPSATRRDGEPIDGLSVQGILLQFSLMCLIFYLWTSPIIQPMKLMVVLFHELGHGLTAILSGGKVISIWITRDEGGGCETEGGMPLLIVSAGYLGSMLFGGLILYLSRFRFAGPLVFGVLTLLLVSAILTVLKDDFSRTFASILAGAFILLGFFAPGLLGGFVLRVIGTVTCLYSIFDIYWDVLSDRGGYEVANDAEVFARLSGTSAQTVGMVWLVVAVVFFLFVLRMTLAVTAEEAGSVAPVREGAPA